MTAETESNQPESASSTPTGTSIVRTHLVAAALALVLGSLVALVASLQLIVPDLLSGNAFTSYGRIAPAARVLIVDGWLVLGLLGSSYVALTRVTGGGVRSGRVATASAALIAIGVLAGALGIILGHQSGIVGQEAPIWARAVSVIGYALATVSIVGTARTAKDALGATGWYLTAAPIWLTLSALVGIVPAPTGIAGTIQTAFSNAGTVGLFAATASVGLIYHVITSITHTDPADARPLATLGFWSLTLVWANLAAVHLVYSPTPDWYETLAIAFTIAALIPVLTIAADLALMLRGRMTEIADRGSLRYGLTSAAALVLATVVMQLMSWRATSAVAQFSTWVNGLDVLIVLGGGTFAIFAATSVMRGGSAGRPSFHYVMSALGLFVSAGALLVGGVVVGFTWAAGPASQEYANAGEAWRLTAEASEPYLWISAVGIFLFTLAQIVYALGVGRADPAPETSVETAWAFDLGFEGAPRYATWRRLIWGVVGVWAFAGLMTWILPMLDTSDRDPTILADTFRTYEDGSDAALGRQIYVSEGCIECHTQQVRPVGTDVGLGPVSIAGDYAHEQPALLGNLRFGPDLMHYASQVEFFDRFILQAKLEDPRGIVPWSTMPSYAHLSDDDLAALVSYMETLR